MKTHLEVALQAARRAGSYALGAERAGAISVRTKEANDYVTDVDIQIEQLIKDTIRLSFPHDGIFGEEGGESGDVRSNRWVIDPIDGTTNFFRGMPNYTISIAWEEVPYHPLVGVVFNPRQNELFWAAKGEGAFLNGQRITVSSVRTLSEAIVILVPPHRRRDLADSYFETMRTIFAATSDLRSFGSCALELAYIAGGRVDGYYERALGYYDMAAGMLILQEAGGIVTPAFEQLPFSDTSCDILASNGHLHQALGSLIA
ncbi:MAG: inositol monophosphatase [Spirochaetales bacterium]|nr:inositol monophosphatase [Spirochaetales bacterium]